MLTSLLVLSCVTLVHSKRNITGESRLYEDLIYSNNPHERPRYDKSENVTVRFGFNLRTVSHFDESRQQLVCTGWFRVTWEDNFLTWNPQLYDGTESIRPPDGYVWRPKLVAANSFQQLDSLGGTYVSLEVSASGKVIWSPGDMFNIPCEVSIERYPFDNLVCLLDLVVWMQPETEVELIPMDRSAGVDQFKRSGQWTLISTEVDKVQLGEGLQTQSKATIKMTLSRKSSNFVFSFILPVLVLSLLGTFVFLIPNDSGEKISFAITIPLSYGVYMSFLTTMVPQTSDGISIFVVFISLTLALSAIFVILSIFSVRLSTRTEHRPIPESLVTLTLWVEKVKPCGQKKQTSDPGSNNDVALTDSDKGREEQPNWSRVSKALDLIFFWMMFLPIVTTVIIMLIYIIGM